MIAYLEELPVKKFVGSSLSVLREELDRLRVDRVVIPLTSPRDVQLQPGGQLSCGYRLSEQACADLMLMAAKGCRTLLSDLTSLSPLAWPDYRDILQIVTQHAWRRLRRMSLYCNRATGLVETLGLPDRHIDLVTAYDRLASLGRTYYALLHGRRVQFWFVGQQLQEGYWPGYVVEVDEGGLATWMTARAIVTPCGGTVSQARGRDGRMLTAHNSEQRFALLQKYLWTPSELARLERAIPRFLRKELNGFVAKQLTSRYKLGRLVAGRIQRRCEKDGSVLTGELLLQLAMKLGARPLKISIFDDAVRRSAYYWLAGKSDS